MAALPRTVSLVIASVAGVIMLCTLGVWQLERLNWKNALIAERRAELAASPVPFSAVLSEIRAGKAVDYRPVRLSGRFVAGTDLRLFSTAYGPGWEIVSPFLSDEGVLVLVDRGFLPDVSGREVSRPAPPDSVSFSAPPSSSSSPSSPKSVSRPFPP